MILSYDLIKKGDITLPTPVKDTANTQPKDSEISIDSSFQIDSNKPFIKKTLSISSDISKKEDYFLQKDLLNMINSFSVNDNDEFIQRQSINSLIGSNNNNNDYNNTSVISEWNDKVIDIKKISAFANESDKEKEEVGEEEELNEEEVLIDTRKQSEDYKHNSYNNSLNTTNTNLNPKTNTSINNSQFYYQSQSQAPTQAQGLSTTQLSKNPTKPALIPMTLSINKQAILNCYHTFDISELAKWSYILSKDQKACLFLQSKLQDNPKLVDLLYINLKDQLIDLMYGGFSNYFIQKLIDNLSIKQIEEIIIQIIHSNSFAILGLDPHGTRVIQKIIERIKKTNKLLGIITSTLLQYINQFIFDSNANHIIIQYATIIKYPKNQVIYDYLTNNILEVSHDKNSCCALQKCIEVANEIQKADLFTVIGQNSNVMITDDFGNYALQFIIPLCNETILNQIVNSFIDKADVFALNKYSSNVIEKCIEYCHSDVKLIIIKQFMNEQSIMNLLFNKYGNYVLQTILSYSTEPYFSIILSYIEKYSKQLSFKKYGQKFLAKLKKSYPQLRFHDMNVNVNTNSNPYCGNRNNNCNSTSHIISNNALRGDNNCHSHSNVSNYYCNYYKNTMDMNMNSDLVNGNQGNYAYNTHDGTPMLSNPAYMMNNPYSNNNNSNTIPYYYNNTGNTNQQIQGDPYHQTNQYLPQNQQNNKGQQQLKPKQQHITDKDNMNPMNINIAVNNYYASPIYNYYCFQNGLQSGQRYPNSNGNNNSNPNNTNNNNNQSNNY